MKIFGLTAPFQHGKTELRPVFEGLGFEFVDLNEFQNALRVKGTSRHDLYHRLLPGSLSDDGGETVLYYQKVTPEIRGLTVPQEIPLVLEATLKYISSSKPDSSIVVSWELLPKIMMKLPLDHAFVFTQPRARWFSRLRSRAKEQGWENDVPDDHGLECLITTMNVVPEGILNAVQTLMPGRHTVLDVSPDDWNANGLREILRSLN